MPATVAAPFPPGARRCRRASGRSGGIEGHRGLRAGARSATVRGGHAMAGNPYRDATLPAMLDAVAARFGDREAVVLRERRLTYADLHREVGRLARGLLALGVAPGDTVALWLTNLPEWLVVQHACARIGAVVVALNTRYRAHELDYILRQSDATTLVCLDHALHVDFLEILDEVLPGLHATEPDDLRAERCPELRRVICLSEDVYGGALRYRDV